MSVHFAVTDPRGIVVECSEDTWIKHILANRSWMKGWENKITITLTDPLSIYDDGKAQLYYRRNENPGYYYIKVAVKVNGLSGIVLSAYPCDRGKPGEKWIWPASTD